MFSVKRARVGTDVARPVGGGFTCKTCNREFPSFQALGGHRASHNKPNNLVGVDGILIKAAPRLPAKPKRHECPICGLQFTIGQALGGHMRKHQAKNTNTNINALERKINDNQRNAKNMVTMTNSTCSTTTATTLSTVSEAGDEHQPGQRVVKRPRIKLFGVELSMVEPEEDVNLELGLAGRDSLALLDLLQ